MNFDQGPQGCFMQIFSSLQCSGLVIALDLLFFIFQYHYETMILSFEFTVKGKLQRKRNAFPLKQWQCVLRIASIYTFSTLFNSRFPSSRTAAGNRAYTRMIYANYSSFPGFRWRQKYCLSFISFFGFFNTHK